MKARDVKLNSTQKLHTKRSRQKIGRNLREKNYPNSLFAFADSTLLNEIQKARAHAYNMVEKHMTTEATRKHRAVLSIFTTYRESLEIKNDNLFLTVEADFITQPERVPDDARLVAS